MEPQEEDQPMAMDVEGMDVDLDLGVNEPAAAADWLRRARAARRVPTTDPESERYLCSICLAAINDDYGFNSLRGLTCHLTVVHGQDVASVSRAFFGTVMIDGVEYLLCWMCNQTCQTARKLRQDFMRVHPSVDRSGNCPDCGKYFKCQEYLNAHRVKVHPTGPPVPCPICGKEFKAERNMQLHKTRKHPIG